MLNSKVLKCLRNKRLTLLACESPAVRDGDRIICRDCKKVLVTDTPEPETETEEEMEHA